MSDPGKYVTLYFSGSSLTLDSQPPRPLIPYIAYSSFQNAFQMPTLEEGFSEVKTLNWIFEGSDEDRRRFNMYMNVL